MSSGNIYNHRSLQPTGQPAPQHARLNESFDAIRQEFEVMASEASQLRGQRDDFETKVGSQINELNIIRQALYDLETQHSKVRQQFEDELARLRAELLATRQSQGAPTDPRASQNVPGELRQAVPSAGIPPYGEPYYQHRDRERAALERGERERIPERDRGERIVDRERERERERDRELRERDMRERERDRERDQRDPKRLKAERVKTDRPGEPPLSSPPTPRRMLSNATRSDHFSPSLGPGHTPKLPPPPSAIGVGPGLPPSSAYPPAGPSIPSMQALSDSGPGAGIPGMSSSGPSSVANAGAVVPISGGSNGGLPDDMDFASLPSEFKKEGSDWFAVFNPKAKRALDVNLVHTLTHESVVCCVRFSADGKFLATGCNRTAQIYDTKTGQKTCVLFDESAGKSGDLYIRSVCFSPDGKYLATGAEDKQIRIWDIAKKRIRNVFDGHQQEIYSLDFSLDGRLIVSGSGDKTARIWDMADGTSKVLTINDPDSLNNDAGVTSVAISPNGHLVAAGSLDTVVRIWDVSSGTLVERLRGHRDSVYSVAFTPDGKGLVSGSLDKTLKYWDVSALVAAGAGVKGRKEGSGAGPVNGPGAVGRKDGDKPSQCTMNFTGHKDYVLSVAVSHDGQWVVSGSKDRGVQFWDSRTAIVQCMLQGHKNSVISIDLSPAGNILATGSGDWQARIWTYGPPP